MSRCDAGLRLSIDQPTVCTILLLSCSAQVDQLKGQDILQNGRGHCQVPTRLCLYYIRCLHRYVHVCRHIWSARLYIWTWTDDKIYVMQTLVYPWSHADVESIIWD